LYFIQVETAIHQRYIFYYLKCNEEQIKCFAAGTAAKTITKQAVRNIDIVLPSLPTQQRIAEILSNYDRLIDNNTRRIALLEESIHRLYQEWFVYLRFPGCDRVKTFDGVPDGWSRMLFGDALVLQRGFDLPHKDRKPGSIPVYASTGINGFHNVAKVKAPGIVTGRSGSLGSVMYIQQDFWALNTTLWVKEFKQVTVPFAYFLLLSLDLASYQGGSAVPTLNRNAVHAIEITVPDMTIQQKFDEIVHPVFKQIEIFNRYNEKLREARDLLLPRLMNGSLTV
jgi:type I restriction enzyme, S subunit